MSITEEIGERGLGWPVAIGLVVAAISAGPQIAKAGRPLMKKAIKGYLSLHDKAREMMAETGERMQDLYAEAKHEYEHGEEVTEASAVEHHEEPRAEGAKPKRTRKAKSEEGES